MEADEATATNGPDETLEDDDDYVPVVVHKRERLLGTSSYLLLAALLVVGGFVGGAKWKSRDTGAASSASANGAAANGAGFAARAANGTGTGRTGNGNGSGGNGFTGGGGGGGATVGEIKLVDGTNVYVQDAQGNVVKVATGPSTAIQVSRTGTLADLHTGDTVVVQGAAGTDGTVSATSIGSGLPFGRGQRAAGATTSTTGG